MKFILPLLFLLSISITSAQVVLEKNINLEAQSSHPEQFTEIEDKVYFTAEMPDESRQLCRYQPSTGNLEVFYDDNIKSIEQYSQMFHLGDALYFIALRGKSRIPSLCSFDLKTEKLEVLYSSNQGSMDDITNLNSYKKQLIFSIETDRNTKHLGIYNIVNTTLTIFENLNNGESSHPRGFSIDDSEGMLYFAAKQGTDYKLFQMHLATYVITEVVYTSHTSFHPTPIRTGIIHDNLFYFTGHSSDSGQEPYVLDLTAMKILNFPEIRPGPTSVTPLEYSLWKDEVYFVANGHLNQRHIHKYNLTSLEFDQIDNPSQFTGTGSIVVHDNKLFFVSYDNNAIESLVYELHSDLTSTEVARLDNNGLSSYLSYGTWIDNGIYFGGFKDSTGNEIYKYSPGNSQVGLVIDVNQNDKGSNPYYFTPFNNLLFFRAQEYRTGTSTWVYNPATGETDQLDKNTPVSKPAFYTPLGNKIFFTGIHKTDGYGLMYYDKQSKKIESTSYLTPSHIGHVSEITAFEGKIIIAGRVDDMGTEMIIYNPEDDTYQIEDIYTGEEGSYPEDFTSVGNSLFFNAETEDLGNELWKYTSAGGVELVADIDTQKGSYPEYFTVLNGELYFGADKDDVNYIFKYSPSNNQLHQFPNPADVGTMTNFYGFGNDIYFSGSATSRTGNELMKYDATLDSIVLVADINSQRSSSPRDFIDYNGELYFTADTEEYGRELWKLSDNSVSLVADIREGESSSEVRSLVHFNDKLYFTADNGSIGHELYSIAGCLNLFVETTPATSSTLGYINLTVEGGQSPYTFLWSNGETTEDISGLEPGDYLVTVSDASSCKSELTATVDMINNHNETTIKNNRFLYFPNPTVGKLSVLCTSEIEFQIQIFDSRGQFLQHFTFHPSSRNTINLEGLNPGVYFIKTSSQDYTQMDKIILIE